MEFTIKKIISIDKDAENYKKDLKNVLNSKKKELDTSILNMKKEAQDEISAQKKNILEDKIHQAEDTIKNINAQKNKKIKKIQEIYNGEKDNIIDEAFSRIINSFKEG